jgi:hypothetical protein
MSSYLRKIEAERIVLGTVNKQFPDQPLHGLSAGAIATWTSAVATVPGEMLAELSDLGQMVGAMCERSGERADSAGRANLARVNRAVLRFQSRHG